MRSFLFLLCLLAFLQGAVASPVGTLLTQTDVPILSQSGQRIGSMTLPAGREITITGEQGDSYLALSGDLTFTVAKDHVRTATSQPIFTPSAIPSPTIETNNVSVNALHSYQVRQKPKDIQKQIFLMENSSMEIVYTKNQHNRPPVIFEFKDPKTGEIGLFVRFIKGKQLYMITAGKRDQTETSLGIVCSCRIIRNITKSQDGIHFTIEGTNKSGAKFKAESLLNEKGEINATLINPETLKPLDQARYIPATPPDISDPYAARIFNMINSTPEEEIATALDKLVFSMDTLTFLNICGTAYTLSYPNAGSLAELLLQNLQ